MFDEVRELLDYEEKRYVIVDYPRHTETCREKVAMWKEINQRGLVVACFDDVVLDILKSVLFTYKGRDGERRFLLACTSANKRINLNELRVEFGLTRDEADSLTHLGITDEMMLFVTGQARGAVGPIISPDRLTNLEGVYFANDLFGGDKLYDVSITNGTSLLVNANDLFGVLRCLSDLYQRFTQQADGELDVLKWRVRDVNEGLTGVKYLFAGTTVRFRGIAYSIRNPKKEGGSIAMPIPLEHNGTGTRRVFLPINYSYLEDRFERDSF